jgi:glycine cleavage system aminomethyltransferase T
VSNWSPVETQVSRAGGIMPSRAGSQVATHFGSPVSELAACTRAVGLADRSDLGVLTMTGAPASLSELVAHATGTNLAVGGVVANADTWWCRACAGEVVTVTEPPARARILTSLRMPTARLHGLDVRDASADTAAIAVVGRRAADVLAVLGLLGPTGDPRAVPPFTSQTLAGVPIRLLLQTDRRALLLAATAEAEQIWEAIQTAGRRFGLSLVGTDALRLLVLQERVATAQSGGLRHT